MYIVQCVCCTRGAHCCSPKSTIIQSRMRSILIPNVNILSPVHYSEIFSDNNGRGTLCPSDIGNKWKENVYVARMNDVHILREMIEIRDGFKECCILSKEDVSDIIENLNVFFNLYYNFFLPFAIVYHDVRE